MGASDLVSSRICMGGAFEPQFTLIFADGYDAPPPFVPMVVGVGDYAGCLNRGLR